MNDWRPGRILRLETERFRLRSLTADDATDTYIGWWNDAEIQAGFNEAPRGWDRQRAARHITGFDNRSRFHLGIFSKEDGGLIGFFAMFISRRHRSAKTNICVGDKSWWGKDVGVEVRAVMLDFMFDRLGMEKVFGEVQGRNLPSFYNYKKLGFRLEGTLENHLRSVHGGRTGMYYFGLTREEWHGLRGAVSGPAATRQDTTGHD